MRKAETWIRNQDRRFANLRMRAKLLGSAAEVLFFRRPDAAMPSTSHAETPEKTSASQLRTASQNGRTDDVAKSNPGHTGRTEEDRCIAALNDSSMRTLRTPRGGGSEAEGTPKPKAAPRLGAAPRPEVALRPGAAGGLEAPRPAAAGGLAGCLPAIRCQPTTLPAPHRHGDRIRQKSRQSLSTQVKSP